MRDERAFVPGNGATAMGSLDFESLWREWRPRAAAYCRAFPSLSREDAQDIASESVMRAWAARERYDPSRPFAPWFLTITRRLILDSLAPRRELQIEPARLEAEPSRRDEADTNAMRAAEAAFVRRFVARLPERDRELASLVYGQDLRLAEAARLAGMPVGSAKWRLFEIRKALRRAWEREYGQAPIM